MKYLHQLLVYILITVILLSLFACGSITGGKSLIPSATLQMADAAATAETARPDTLETTESSYSDPFIYCAAVKNSDVPDARYNGPRMPEAVVKGLMKASGASPDMPVAIFEQGSSWRCMNGRVYACFVGANLPCDAKADTSQAPTVAVIDYCNSNPNSDFIPAVVTGHETVYEWKCMGRKPVVGKQFWQVDERGFIANIWYVLGNP